MVTPSTAVLTWRLGEGKLGRLAGHSLGDVIQQALMGLQSQHHSWP